MNNDSRLLQKVDGNRYYIEPIEGGHKLWEVEHLARAGFWAKHPQAQEITKQQYDEVLDMIKSQVVPVTDNPPSPPHETNSI